MIVIDKIIISATAPYGQNVAWLKPVKNGYILNAPSPSGFRAVKAIDDKGTATTTDDTALDTAQLLADIKNLQEQIKVLTTEYTVTVNINGMGSVTGGGKYRTGSAAILTATPAEGHAFVAWSDGVTEATRAIVVNKDIVLTAEFSE